MYFKNYVLVLLRDGSECLLLYPFQEIVEESNENEADSDECKTGDDSETKPEMETSEANGQNMSGFHFLTEEEAGAADITDVSTLCITLMVCLGDLIHLTSALSQLKIPLFLFSCGS